MLRSSYFSSSSPLLPLLHPFWEQEPRSQHGAAAAECVKRFKRLGLTQLNVNNSMFVFG